MKSLIPVAATLLAAAPLAAQTADRGAFVVRLGQDTVAVERYTRAGNTITADQAVRAPTTSVRHRTLATTPAGAARSFTYETRRLNNGAPATHAEMTFGADTVVVHVVSGPRDTTLRVAGRGAFPYVGMSYAVVEPVFAAARKAKSATYAATVVSVGAPQSAAMPITFVGRDSLTFAVGGPDLIRARVDARGRVLGISGAATTQKIVVERVADVDVAAVAAGWARRDSAGAAVGVLSPADSVVAAAGGANVRIVYSRPALRGRALMGFMIPYGSVWRTGANAATTFTTSADLALGGAAVPAGSYTLWTLATPQGAQLIVNRQTGQWGTAYDEKQDLVRVPLTVGKLPAPVERFTMAVEPSAAGGTLVYSWGDTRFSVPFTVRK